MMISLSLALTRLIGNDLKMGRTPPLAHAAIHEIAAAQVGEQRHAAVEKRQIDVLPLARLLPGEQCATNAISRPHARREVTER